MPINKRSKLTALTPAVAAPLSPTACGTALILSGILTQPPLYSVNLRITGKSNQPINTSNCKLLVSFRTTGFNRNFSGRDDADIKPLLSSCICRLQQSLQPVLFII